MKFNKTIGFEIVEKITKNGLETHEPFHVNHHKNSEKFFMVKDVLEFDE